MVMRRAAFLVVGLLAALPARAETLSFPVLVPLTGFLSLEGTSQRNGAELALKGAGLTPDIIDTGTSPEAAVTALERAGGGARVGAVAASMLGTQMLAMLPLAAELKLPLVTVSGTASITEQGNPWVFRFFPGDAVTKTAHARYVVEELGKRRPALIYQTTAYGQSGKTHLESAFKALGADLVFAEGVDPAAKDLLPVLTKALAAKPELAGAASARRADRASAAAGGDQRDRVAHRRRVGDAPAEHGGVAGTQRTEGRLRRDRRLPGVGRVGGVERLHRLLPRGLRQGAGRLRAWPV